MLTVIGGFLLDALLGDPHFRLHPVRVIGGLCEQAEMKCRQYIPDDFFAGAMATTVVITITLAVSALVYGLLYALHPWLGAAAGAIIIYFSIALKDLCLHAKRVGTSLRSGNLIQARERVGMIVGRDTEYLDEEDIVRATVETVAENSVDGILSPLFYACLFGPLGAITYRAINTMDSMYGYKNERYRYFGTTAARLDDIANYIPARLSVILITLAACITGYDWKRAWKIALRDGRNHSSPNSGWSEAAISGALGHRLGGTHTYGGTEVVKPTIGEELRHITVGSINAAMMIITWSLLLFLAGGIVIWSLR